MRAFGAGELAGMQDAQRKSMMDSCEVYAPAYARHPNRYGVSDEPLYWTLVWHGPCGFHYLTTREVMGAAQVPADDAEIRLPSEAQIGSDHSILVTCLKGVQLPSALAFAVSGDAKVGPTGQVVGLNLITDGIQPEGP